MSFYSTLKQLFGADAPVETKATQAPLETKSIGHDALGRMNPIAIYTAAGTALTTALDEYAGKNSAQMCSIFYTIINRVQATAKSIPWSVYQIATDDEKGKKVNGHPLGTVLYRPNPRQSWSDFVCQYLGYLLSDGNVFIYIIAPTTGLNRGIPQEMHIMPRNTEVVVGDNYTSQVRGYRVPANVVGGYKNYSADEVIHIKKFNILDTNYGLSPVQAAKFQLGSITAAQRQRIELFANGGPRTLMFPKEGADNLTAEQQKTLEHNMRTRAVSYFDAALGSVQIGLSSIDLDILNSLNNDFGDVADMLGFPSILLSGNKSTTYNNVSEAHKALYIDCVLPLLDELKWALNHKFGVLFKDQVLIDMDLSGIEVLKPNLSELIQAASSATFASINEQRIWCGLGKVKGGDGFLVNAGLVYSATIDAEHALPTADAYDPNDSDVEGE